MSKNANYSQKTAKSVSKLQKIDKNKTDEEKYFYSEEEDKVIVSFVLDEFEKRRNERKPYDLAWELNINFLLGNQFSYIAENGEIEKAPKQFYWQGEEVYNHISPIIETRLAKLGKVRPTFAVKPVGSEDSDIYCAKITKAILSQFAGKHKLNELISSATVWSEVCGTSFYKVIWDSEKLPLAPIDGEKCGALGDADICVVSPFEVFPDSNACENLDACNSLIHARPMPVKTINEIYCVGLNGRDIDTYGFEQTSSGITFAGKSNAPKVTRNVKHDQVLVLEYYEKPSHDYPNGKLVIVADDKLLYSGDLPFITGDEGERGFPFVRQVSSTQIGTLWGTSVIERCIPIQRAYNSIKNRKHEFLTRLACGVLAVEDGSCDIDNLEVDGLAPGKIVVYRNGSTPPRFIDPGSIPNDFSYEEDKLLNEFITVSGVSELMRDSAVPSSVSSGTALSLLIEQDETRLSVSAEYIRNAVKGIAERVIKLYKQFAKAQRLSRVCDDNGDIELYYWTSSDISYEDITLESDNELSESPAQRKSMLFDLFKAGLFNDQNGKLSNRAKSKILEGLGFSSYESIQDLSALHIKRAIKENLELTHETLIPLDIDDHELHILEHTKFLLSSEAHKCDSAHIDAIKNHILEHNVMLFAGNQTQVSSKQLEN